MWYRVILHRGISRVYSIHNHVNGKSESTFWFVSCLCPCIDANARITRPVSPGNKLVTRQYMQVLQYSKWNISPRTEGRKPTYPVFPELRNSYVTPIILHKAPLSITYRCVNVQRYNCWWKWNMQHRAYPRDDLYVSLVIYNFCFWFNCTFHHTKCVYFIYTTMVMDI